MSDSDVIDLLSSESEDDVQFGEHSSDEAPAFSTTKPLNVNVGRAFPSPEAPASPEASEEASTRKRQRLFDTSLNGQVARVEEYEGVERLTVQLSSQCKLTETLRSELEQERAAREELERTVGKLRRHAASLQRSWDTEVMEKENALEETRKMQKEKDERHSARMADLELNVSRITAENEYNAEMLQAKEQECERLQAETKATMDRCSRMDELEEKLRLAEQKTQTLQLTATEAPVDIAQKLVDAEAKLAEAQHQSKGYELEVERMRKQQENQLMLKEQIKSLKAKLRRTECYLEEAMKSHEQTGEDVWGNVLHELFGEVVSPVQLRSKIGALQQQVFEATQKECEAREAFSRLEMESSSTARRHLVLQKETEMLRERLQQAEERSEVVQAQLDTESQHRKSLARILQAYEEEENLTMTQMPDTVRIEQIEAQRNSLKEKDAYVQELQKQLQGSEQLRQANTSLTLRLEHALSELNALKQRLSRGEHNPALTKLLTLPGNPSYPKKDTDPVNKLRIQFQKVRSELETQIETLEAEREEAKKSRDRLVQVYQSVTQDFKDMYFKLTGYWMDLVKKRTYSFRPEHPEVEGDKFVIHASKDGRLCLIPTDCVYGGRIMAQFMETAQQQQNEPQFPIFFSKLTLALDQLHRDTNRVF